MAMGSGRNHLTQTFIDLYKKYGGDDNPDYAIYNVATDLNETVESVKDMIENQEKEG